MDFELIAVNLDQKQLGFPAHVLPAYLDQLGIRDHIENQDTYSIVMDKIPVGKTMCRLCSRMRRGILYQVEDELGAIKIAVGVDASSLRTAKYGTKYFSIQLTYV